MDDSLCHLAILEFKLDPEPFDLGIAFEELYFNVVSPTLQRLHKEERFGILQLNDLATAAGIQCDNRRQSLSYESGRERIERL